MIKTFRNLSLYNSLIQRYKDVTVSIAQVCYQCGNIRRVFKSPEPERRPSLMPETRIWVSFRSPDHTFSQPTSSKTQKTLYMFDITLKRTFRLERYCNHHYCYHHHHQHGDDKKICRGGTDRGSLEELAFTTLLPRSTVIKYFFHPPCSTVRIH